jgi:hypothetical protein
MGRQATGSEMAVPAMLLPFKRSGTDIVERQLDIFPYPNANVTSQNASQILRFDFPPSVMLDMTNQGLELSFNLIITRNSSLNADVFSRIQAIPGECMGHLINTIRVYINNEMVEETLNFGQLSSIMQQISENVVDKSCFEQNVRGRYVCQATNEYEIRNDGQMLLGGGNFQVGNVAASNSNTSTITFESSALVTLQGATPTADQAGLWLTVNQPFTATATPTYSVSEAEILTFASSTTVTLGGSLVGGSTASAMTTGTRPCSFSISALGYNIPQTTRGMPIWVFKAALRGNGLYYRIPLAIPGQFFNQRQGLIPLHRLPKVRMEITFNPSTYVLFSPTSATLSNTAANFLLQDYQISDIRISAMYAQSPSLVSMYDAGNWNYSFLGYSYYTAPVSSNSNLIPISMPFKSSRYLICVFANPAQYTGMVTTNGSSTAPGAYRNGTTLAATAFPNTGAVNAYADSTRWSNWYGLGGAYGGPEYVDNSSNSFRIQASSAVGGAETPGAPGMIQGGNDNLCRPSMVNFQQNNEWIYQQDLTKRDQLWRELTKVVPAVKRSTFFNVNNFPGIRFVLAINLQTPELSDQFICGNRAAQGQSLGYLRFYTESAGGSNASQQYTGATSTSPIAACLLQAWICYDRVVKVQERSGLTVVDY